MSWTMVIWKSYDIRMKENGIFRVKANMVSLLA